MLERRGVGALGLAVLLVCNCKEATSTAGDTTQRCVEMCETQNACDAGEPVDCAPTCEDYAEANEISGCGPEYDAALSCWESLEDACVVEGCSSEEQAWLVCSATYCVAHPEEPLCSGGTGGSGGGTTATSTTATTTGGGGGGTGGGPSTVCPYSVETLSCADACANLKAVAGTCENDPTVPAEIAQLLSLANMGQGNGCLAACAADSPFYTDQWRCFQGAPSSPCTAIAGCTASNCPP